MVAVGRRQDITLDRYEEMGRSKSTMDKVSVLWATE